ncbi:tellurite resistance TerB family protein [Methylobacterium phyllosphaerae]
MAEAKQMVDALVRERQGSTIAATAALGGVALIVGLALKVLPGRAPAPAPISPSQDAGRPPTPHTPFDHTEVSEDEAKTMLRAMVAATMADGLMDAAERERLYSALTAAQIGVAGRAWLDRELAEPVDVDELAAGVSTPEQAARIYAAARLAIEPDTLQERQFLKMLAEALDVPAEAVARFDEELAS